MIGFPLRRSADPQPWAWAWVAAGVAASAATAGVAWLAPTPMDSVEERFVAAVMVLPVAVLVLAWWQIGPRFRHPLVATAAWAVPLLAAPPLFSLDVYAYLAQGWMVATGHDPYVMTLGTPQLSSIQVGTHWAETTSVYPPGSLLIFGAVYTVSGGIPWLGVVLFRLLHLGCLLATGWAVGRLAPRVGTHPSTAAWAGIACPLMILQGVGGVHNDAVLVALIALAVLAAVRGGWGALLSGGVLVGVAVCVKQSGAAAGIGVVALAWAASPGRSWTSLLGRASVAAAAAIGTFLVLSFASGYGLGWSAPSAGSPLEATSNSPLSWIIQAVRTLAPHLDSTAQTALTALSGMMVLAAWGWLAARFGPRPGRAGQPWVVLVGGLLAFALLGPAFQVWYLLWAAPFVALTRPGIRWQEVWLIAAVVATMLGPIQETLGVALGLAAAALGSWALWWSIHPGNSHILEPIPESEDS